MTARGEIAFRWQKEGQDEIISESRGRANAFGLVAIRSNDDRDLSESRFEASARQ